MCLFNEAENSTPCNRKKSAPASFNHAALHIYFSVISATAFGSTNPQMKSFTGSKQSDVDAKMKP